MKLSILVLTVPRRLTTFFPKIIRCLEGQIKDRKDIEVFGLYDNKKMTVGGKRNALLHIARGKFTTFVDDDDRVSDDYIDSIMAAIDANPDADCIIYDIICTIKRNGIVQKEKLCKYGIEYEKFGATTPDGKNWAGKPEHRMVYNSKISKEVKFPEKNFKEDLIWTKEAALKIKNQVKIDKVLYYFDFDYAITETQ